MDSVIKFMYENVSYTVDGEAYDYGKILLPDGRVLVVDSWLETLPPKPERLHELSHSYHDRDIVEIANIFEAVIAIKEEKS